MVEFLLAYANQNPGTAYIARPDIENAVAVNSGLAFRYGMQQLEEIGFHEEVSDILDEFSEEGFIERRNRVFDGESIDSYRIAPERFNHGHERWFYFQDT